MLSLKTIQQRLALKGISLIGPCVKTKEKTVFACREGHTWSANLGSVLNTSGCPHCSGRAKLTREDIEYRLRRKNIHLIGGFYGMDEAALFGCAKGHQWEATPKIALQRKYCPECMADEAPTSFEINVDLKEHGIRMVKGYAGLHTKALFECFEGHQWEAKPSQVLKERKCRECEVHRGFDPRKPGKVYFLSVWHPRLTRPVYKVGITNGEIETRIQGMQPRPGVQVEIIDHIEYKVGAEAYALEQRLHKEFAEFAYTGGQLLIANGYTELFTVNVWELRG
jgi:T5orf172 domain